ncbi:hypothetical protein AMJ57_00640 [Parcubacteria bacterium SG8_24]|nr:MAG: hypothetical protein AMJ57_00640 [Parcubacteria bacterium SG8_24]
MFLQKLEMTGFKSFVDRTEIDFLPPSAASKGITAVVGPNGSGKSNVADAIRWVLGEQSTKLLRGKKAEDVIFSGSEKKPRANFAEVTISLNNEDGQLPMDYSEVSISRRIYRDGDSEYLINKNKVRLTDIQLLLAQAQFGARTYSVIGQGMVDNILIASPQERKEFFDEAAGVKQYQLKRHQSLIKIKTARENLSQAEMLLTEIAPRLRSLARQAKRLETREGLEEELHALKHQYYGKLWERLRLLIDDRRASLDKLESAWKDKETMREAAQRDLSALEKEETEAPTDRFTELQDRYDGLVQERAELESRRLKIRSDLEVTRRVRQETSGSLPLSKIIDEVNEIGTGQDTAVRRLTSASDLKEAQATIPDFEKVGTKAKGLATRLERPASEPPDHESDPKLTAEMEGLRRQVADKDREITEIQSAIQEYNRSERQKKSKFFDLQRELQQKIGVVHDLERRLNEERVEMARLDTRREALETEMVAELGENADRIKTGFTADDEGDPESYQPRIQKLKYQLELIGGIDPEVMKEYEETRERHDFLESQTNDLRKAIADLRAVIAELDLTIKAVSEASFRRLNKSFDRYFKTLFGGGHAELIQLKSGGTADAEPDAEGGGDTDGPTDQPDDFVSRDVVTGIDIKATPPGKKISNITMLSGGERALTSIALICAIMTTNPSPFVVLDEVDAALDESNAERFAAILQELAERTQFIIITHNRYTMNRSNVLYGVTMNDAGTSQILSVNLEEAGKMKGKSRKVRSEEMAAA